MKKCVKIMMFTFLLFVSFYLGRGIVLADSFPFEGIIDADSLVVYSANGSISANKATELVYGTRVTVLGDAVNIGGKCALYKISYEDGKIGYSCKQYIRNYNAEILTTDKEGIETYNDYCNMLKSQGFVESYCPYLYYLHSKYPQWVFKADVLTVSMEEAATNEQNKCGLQTSNPNYWLYETPLETDYYYVRSNVVEMFMDPRNSLFENRIFQFFDINDNKNEENDAALLALVGNGNLKQYIDIFKVAAQEQELNVVQLMVRSYQEGNNKVGYYPSSGTYTTTTGKTYNSNSLDGYYNFYNINAYGSTVFVNALGYAASFFDLNNSNYLTYQRPWNSPEKAIKGGAEFLKVSYIDKGQDSIYYQKFNVSSYRTNTMYQHQYMTNIWAPSSEGLLTYNAYKNSNSLNKELVFTIPVYQNMGEQQVQPINKNTNSKLKNIKIDGVLIDGFDGSVLEQAEVFLDTNNDSFVVSAEAEETTTTVEGTGTYTFSNNVANVKVKATAEDGSFSEYTVKVNKVVHETEVQIKPSDVVSKMNVKVNNTFIYGISVNTTVQALTTEVVKNGGSATVMDSSNKVKTSGNLATGDKITIKAGNESVSYVIAVRGDNNGDAVIDLKDFVLCQSHILKKMTLTDEKFIASDVNYDGVVDLKDFVLIQSHILKKLTL